MPIKELVRWTELSRNTVRAALRSDDPPVFRMPARASKLESFKDEIHRLLKQDPRLSGVRVREEIEPLGFAGGKSIVDDYLREIRPIFLKLRTHQRTIYRRGEVCQWDLWETSLPVPVGHGQVRRAWVVVCDEVGYIPFDPQAASLMFMLVSRRYERASMIVTSNEPFSAWGRRRSHLHSERTCDHAGQALSRARPARCSTTGARSGSGPVYWGRSCPRSPPPPRLWDSVSRDVV